MRPYSLPPLALVLFVSCVSLDASSMAEIDASGLSSHDTVLSLEVESRLTEIETGEDGIVFMESIAPSAATIEEAIRTAALESGFVGGFSPDGHLTLRAVLRRAAMVEGTRMGFARECQVVIDWRLSRGSSDEPLFEDRISTNCRRTVSDEFSGDARLAAAMEGAVRANIQSAFEAIESTGALDES